MAQRVGDNMSLSSVLGDRGSKERAFILGCSPILSASIGKTADSVPEALRFADLVSASLLVERERAVEATTIGTAFDFRVRFDLGGFDPESTVARTGVDYLQAILDGEGTFGSSQLHEAERNWPYRDEYAAHKLIVLRQGFEEAAKLSHGSPEDRDRAAILMAWCEQTFRGGTRALGGSLGERLVGVFDGKELAASIDSSWLRYLGAIRTAGQPQVDEWLTSIRKERGRDDRPPGLYGNSPGDISRTFYVPNPGFLGSGLVGGADGDWIVGDTLIDCKTDQAITTSSLREHLLQLIGYALLDLDNWYKIRKVAIWYPRFGILPTWSLDALLSGDSSELLPKLREEVRRSWGQRQALAVRQPVDQRRVGVLLAQNVNTPFEMLTELVAATDDNLTLKHVANNRNTPLEVLRQLAEHPEPAVREQAAKNTALPVDLLTALLGDRQIRVRRAATSNPALPVETLLARANDPNYRTAAAANPSLPVERLMQLARESGGNLDLRKALAKNSAATADVLMALNYWEGEATLILRREEMTPELVAYIYAPDGERDVRYLQGRLRDMWSWQAIGQRARLHTLGQRQGPDPLRRLQLSAHLTGGFTVAGIAQVFGLSGVSNYALEPDVRVEAVIDHRALVGSRDTTFRAFAATHRESDAELLRALATDPELEVRSAVALNPKTPAGVLNTFAMEAVAAGERGADMRRFLALNPASSVRIDATATLDRIEAEAVVAGETVVATKRAEDRGSETSVLNAEREAGTAKARVANFASDQETPHQKSLRIHMDEAEKKADAAWVELMSLKSQKASRSPLREANANVAETKESARKARSAWEGAATMKGLRAEAARLRKRATSLRAAYDRTDTHLAPLVKKARESVYLALADDVKAARSLLENGSLSPSGDLFLTQVAKSQNTAPEILAAIANAGLRGISLQAAMNEATKFAGKAELIKSTHQFEWGWMGCECQVAGFREAAVRCDELLTLAIATYPESPTEVLEQFFRRCQHVAVRAAAENALRIRGWEAAEPSTSTELVLGPVEPAEVTLVDLQEKASSASIWDRSFAAEHPELTPDVMIRMASDTRAEVRTALARNPSAPSEILDFLGGEKSIQVRRAVASHPRASNVLLEQLARENDFEIHWRLALNTGTPPALLTILASDSEPDIAVSAMLNPSTPRNALEVVAAGADHMMSAFANALLARPTQITDN